MTTRTGGQMIETCLLWACQHPPMAGDVICGECAAYFRVNDTCACGKRLIEPWADIGTCASCTRAALGLRHDAFLDTERLAEERIQRELGRDDEAEGFEVSPIGRAIMSDTRDLWAWFRGVIDAGGLPSESRGLGHIRVRDGSPGFRKLIYKLPVTEKALAV